MRFFTIAACLTSLAVADVGRAEECRQWPLREVKGRAAYDGDTIYIRLPLDPPLDQALVRVAGIDAPELRGRCPAEKAAAEKAAVELNRLLRQAEVIEYCGVKWDKYGGRIDADVLIDGRSLAEEMLRRGLVRAYRGEKRSSWCD